MNEREKTSKGSIMIFERKSISLTGVVDILNFDETAVVMSTELGTLSVEGYEMHIKKMDIESGNVDIDGEIAGVMYIDDTSRKKGLFGRRK